MRRGFTLYEALLTFFLVLVVLGVLAGLLRTYSQAVRNQVGKARIVQAARLGLDRMRNELREAATVNPPVSGELSFLKPDPAQLRYHAVPPIWDPHAAARQCRVRYHLTQGRLWREVRLFDGTVSDNPLLDGVEALHVTPLPEQKYELALEVRDGTRVRRLLTRVVRVLP